MEAWVFDAAVDVEDRRLPHKSSPNRPVSEAYLQELGVSHWQIDTDNWDYDPALLHRIKQEHGFLHSETLTVAPDAMEDFEQKTEKFFHEHLHPYEESRVILDGSGYWDIRDYNHNWIRFKVNKGDMITLVPGMYHRFTLDSNNYIKAVLLYKDIPSRVDVLRPIGDKLEVRKEYVHNILEKPKYYDDYKLRKRKSSL